MNEQEFSDTVEAAIQEIGAQAVADMFDVSLSTVYRWARGSNYPLPFVRDFIVLRLEARTPA